MGQEISNNPHYRDTIARLEAVKRTNTEGNEFWMARDIHPIVGYPVWDKFEPVISRATAALRENGIDPSHHIAQTSNMMGVGKGAQRPGIDYFLSRTACRLIAMNGDPSKPEIAGAQAYFLVQTHRMEAEDHRSEDEKRLELRDKVSESVKKVSGVAQDAGVRSKMQGIFHDARRPKLIPNSKRHSKNRRQPIESWQQSEPKALARRRRHNQTETLPNGNAPMIRALFLALFGTVAMVIAGASTDVPARLQERPVEEQPIDAAARIINMVFGVETCPAVTVAVQLESGMIRAFCGGYGSFLVDRKTNSVAQCPARPAKCEP